MITILASIFVFGILVTVHEFGHFITAKLTGMRVDEFAVGFGPTIYQTKRGETQYSIRLIPLGGYNKIAGMDPEEEPTEDGFTSKPIYSRMLVILAGALMNFILPVVLFFSIFAVSGIDKPVNEPVLGGIIQDKAASHAGLMPGDRILSVNGQTIATFDDLVINLKQYPNKEVVLQVERAGNQREYRMTAEYDEEMQRPLIGVYPKFEKQPLGILEAAELSVKYTKNVIVSMTNGLVKIFTGTAPAEVSGPIGVAQMAGEIAEQGILPLLNFVAFLSINLGIMNLLPIPALDGGHFIVLIVEALRGKPLSPKTMNAIQMLGFSIILAIMAVATFMDLTK